MDTEKVIKAIEVILDLNSAAIIGALEGTSIPQKTIDVGKRACEIVTEAGVYQFDTNCSFGELLGQIEKFVEDGMNENV